MSHHWTAKLIGSNVDQPALLLRTELTLDRPSSTVRAARWLVSAQGVVEAYLDGQPASRDVLTPGWSAYEWRLRYRDYDVTEQLAASDSPIVLGLSLGNGWYRGSLTWLAAKNVYGDRLGAIAELHVTFDDGHTQVEVTDDDWMTSRSPVLQNDLYDGQTLDARLQPNWLQPGLEDSGWRPADVIAFDPQILTPYIGPPVVRHEERSPLAIWTSPGGQTLVDFGQNLVGWVKLHVQGKPGQTVTLRHAEVLENGELGVRPLRGAKATDRFVLSGRREELEPTFTFHGFRYVEVSGWPGRLTADDLAAVVVSSDLRRTGTFACSDPMLNQLHANVVWGLRGNFLDVPTDCPQRDERLGWTGDIAVFAPTACFLFDVQDFMRDWLRDLAAEQAHAAGMVAFVVPDALKYIDEATDFPTESTAIWSDAAVWVPWALWQAYGNRTVIEETYPSMVAHLNRVQTLLSPTGLWDTGFQFGDWLDPDAPPDDPAAVKADSGVVASACLYRTSRIVASAAQLLGHDDDAQRFHRLADRTRSAFRSHYVNTDGTILSDCSTVYALAIAFGLLDEPLRSAAGDRLAELVAARDYVITTGFAGTPFICDALTDTGHLDVAYRLLLQRDCPSWLYPVTMGATTIWERWDAMLPDGSINPGEMTSFNHYALGAVADWMHRVIGGLNPAQPGYSNIRIAPRPGGGLTWAATSLETPNGRVSVRWELVEDDLRVDVDIPEGATAEIELPGQQPVLVGEGQHTLIGGGQQDRPVAVSSTSGPRP